MQSYLSIPILDQFSSGLGGDLIRYNIQDNNARLNQKNSSSSHLWEAKSSFTKSNPTRTQNNLVPNLRSSPKRNHICASSILSETKSIQIYRTRRWKDTGGAKRLGSLATMGYPDPTSADLRKKSKSDFARSVEENEGACIKIMRK